MSVNSSVVMNKKHIKIIEKLIANGYADEASIKALTAEKMLEIKGVSVQELKAIIELQKLIQKGSCLLPFLVQRVEVIQEEAKQ